MSTSINPQRREVIVKAIRRDYQIHQITTLRDIALILQGPGRRVLESHLGARIDPVRDIIGLVRQAFPTQIVNHMYDAELLVFENHEMVLSFVPINDRPREPAVVFYYFFEITAEVEEPRF